MSRNKSNKPEAIDKDNPFAKLIDKFSDSSNIPRASKQGAQVLKSSKGSPASKIENTEKYFKSSPQRNTEQESSALFLQAMGSGTIRMGTAPTVSKIHQSIQESTDDDALFYSAMGTKLNQAKQDISAKATEANADIPKSTASAQSTVLKHKTDVSDGDFFAEAMRGVTPVESKGRMIVPPVQPLSNAPNPTDSKRALQRLLEGAVEFALHHSDEYMEGHVIGVDPAILVRMQAGQLSPEAHLDLHGLNADQALSSLTQFIKNSYQRNLRTVIIVTGRGKNSPGGQGVLRSLLADWLCKDPFKRVVLAFCTAKASDGGPGAVYVLLRKYKKSRGKIVWEQYLPE